MKRIPCFLWEPTQSFKQVGIVCANDPGAATIGGAIKTLKAKTAEVGADAVIVREVDDSGVIGNAIVFTDSTGHQRK